MATGGGVVLGAENIKAMKTSGMIVWLSATAETIRNRMLQDNSNETFRPALTDKGKMEEIEDMLLKRNPLYDSAGDLCVPTDDMPVDAIVQTIIEKLKKKDSGTFFD